MGDNEPTSLWLYPVSNTLWKMMTNSVVMVVNFDMKVCMSYETDKLAVVVTV